MGKQVPVCRHVAETAFSAADIDPHALFQALPLGACTVDANGCVVSLNPEGERLLGWSTTACRGAILHDLIACEFEPQEPVSDLCPVAHALTSGESIEVARMSQNEPTLSRWYRVASRV